MPIPVRPDLSQPAPLKPMPVPRRQRGPSFEQIRDQAFFLLALILVASIVAGWQS